MHADKVVTTKNEQRQVISVSDVYDFGCQCLDVTWQLSLQILHEATRISQV